MSETREKAARPFDTLFEAYDTWYDREPGRSLFEIEATALKEMMPDVSGTETAGEESEPDTTDGLWARLAGWFKGLFG